MEDICRLCCSSKFVNNNIFDEENALYLKMSLYLPIKIFKNDRLPQKVCDRCSCKVNDFYQFCNEAIEVQNRLRSSLISTTKEENESVEVTHIKESGSPAPNSLCDRATQTENLLFTNESIKIEEGSIEPDAVIKQEYVSFDCDAPAEYCSDNSDMCLITLKERKKMKKLNGVEETRKKKKNKLEDWELLIDSLPEGAELSLVDRSDIPEVKEELSDDSLPELLIPVKMKKMKKVPNSIDMYQCCMCLTQCYSKNEMLQHYRQHGTHALPSEPPMSPPPPPPGPGPQRCSRCKKEVPAKQWVAHWQKHWARDRRPYCCALCEAAYSDHHQIFKHGLTHTSADESTRPAKRYVCDLCDERFVHMRYLQGHRTRAHPEAASKPLALRCGTCARDFAHLNSLRRHLRAHTGERNHLCNVCGKTLSSREHLKFHIRIHTEYKPNVCKTCGKGFVKKCNLTLHERVHSGEKPHVCSHCGKAFSQRSTLVIHERYHSGARPYACALCGRGFVAKGLLTMHLKTTCI